MDNATTNELVEARKAELVEMSHRALLRWATQLGDDDPTEVELVEAELEKRFGQVEEDAWFMALDETDWGEVEDFKGQIEEALRGMDLSEILGDALEEMDLNGHVDFEKGIEKMGLVHESEIEDFDDMSKDIDDLQGQLKSLDLADFATPLEIDALQRMHSLQERGILGRLKWILTGR